MWEKIAYLLWHREEGCSQPDFSCERLLTTDVLSIVKRVAHNPTYSAVEF